LFIAERGVEFINHGLELVARWGVFATQNVRHFADIEADVINPWEAVGSG
jgi:hypothetical protein